MHRITPLQKDAVVLIVSPAEQDQVGLSQMLGQANVKVRGVSTIREAVVLLRNDPAPVVICERDLPDGNWKDVLDALTRLRYPPALIVTSGLADEYLWLEVLNLGGWDVLPKPHREREVLWAVDGAWRHWTGRQHRVERVWKANA